MKNSERRALNARNRSAYIAALPVMGGMAEPKTLERRGLHVDRAACGEWHVVDLAGNGYLIEWDGGAYALTLPDGEAYRVRRLDDAGELIEGYAEMVREESDMQGAFEAGQVYRLSDTETATVTAVERNRVYYRIDGGKVRGCKVYRDGGKPWVKFGTGTKWFKRFTPDMAA